MNSTQSISEGTGWTDKLDDATTLAMLVTAIGTQQTKLAASSHTGLNGQIDRAQHQKQLLGAFGILRIAETIPEAVRAGRYDAMRREAGQISRRVPHLQRQPCP